MQTAFVNSLPDDLLGLTADEDGILGFTRDTLYLFNYSSHFDSLHKKGIVKFPKLASSDSLFSIRKLIRTSASGGNETVCLCVT